MKFLYTIFLLFSLHGLIFSQVDETKNFIWLYSDTILYGKVEYKTPVFARNHFLLDGKKFDQDSVKFYKRDTSFFANLRRVNSMGTSSFAIRIQKGKINLYEDVSTYYAPPSFGPNGQMIGGGGGSRTSYYYNKGDGEIKKAKYSNLAIDLSDNANSVIYLDKFKKARNTATILHVTGGAVILAGVITLINKTSNIPETENQNPDISANIGMMVGGGAISLVGVVFSLSKDKHLQTAIEEYNK